MIWGMASNPMTTEVLKNDPHQKLQLPKTWENAILNTEKEGPCGPLPTLFKYYFRKGIWKHLSRASELLIKFELGLCLQNVGRPNLTNGLTAEVKGRGADEERGWSELPGAGCELCWFSACDLCKRPSLFSPGAPLYPSPSRQRRVDHRSPHGSSSACLPPGPFLSLHPHVEGLNFSNPRGFVWHPRQRGTSRLILEEYFRISDCLCRG